MKAVFMVRFRLTSLENSGLFQLVEVMDEQTPSKDIERIEFVLKCVI